MVWFVIRDKYKISILYLLFQTKLTYGMICYYNVNLNYLIAGQFQTKLTYGMICYVYAQGTSDDSQPLFQTKLTYGMICYTNMALVIETTKYVSN